MTATLSETEDMAKAPKTVAVRLTEEAIKWVRITSGLTGESASEYASRKLVEVAQAEADDLFAKAKADSKAAPKPARKPKGGKA